MTTPRRENQKDDTVLAAVAIGGLALGGFFLFKALKKTPSNGNGNGNGNGTGGANLVASTAPGQPSIS